MSHYAVTPSWPKTVSTQSTSPNTASSCQHSTPTPLPEQKKFIRKRTNASDPSTPQRTQRAKLTAKSSSPARAHHPQPMIASSRKPPWKPHTNDAATPTASALSLDLEKAPPSSNSKWPPRPQLLQRT